MFVDRTPFGSKLADANVVLPPQRRNQHHGVHNGHRPSLTIHNLVWAMPVGSYGGGGRCIRWQPCGHAAYINVEGKCPACRNGR